MSNTVFPSLPGIAIDRARSPVWESVVHRSVAGRCVALAAMTYPLWRYKLRFEVLRSGALAELQAIVGLFNQMRGRADTFLFLDDDDSTATDQQFGVGDGSTRTFQLVRAYGGFVEPVHAVVGSPTIREAGVVKTPTLVNGQATFASAPANGAALTWTGQFYWRCRFDADVLDTERFLRQLWKAQSVKFTTEKP